MMTDLGMEFLQNKSAATPEVLREELPLQRFVGESLSQAVVEGEVALPGGLREETTVLSAEAMAVLERSLAQADRVTIDGKVVFHVLYTQGDPTHISALEASAEFTHPVELPGAQEGMTAPVSLMVEHVEAAAQGGRLHLMAILRVQARVFSDEPMEVVTGVRGMEGLMLRTETLGGCQAVARGEQDVQDVMGGEERATLSGNILLEVVHRSAMPSRPLVVTRHTIPFEETLPLTGEEGDTLCAGAVVKDVAVLSQEGQEEGSRTLRAEVLLGLNAQAARQRDLCLLLDAYTTQGDCLALEKQEVRRALAHKQVHTAESGKLTLLLDGQTPVRTPLRASLRPVVTELSRAGGKLNVEGMMEVNLLYMTDETEAPQTYQTEEPFRMCFACDLSLPESLVLTAGNIDLNGITSDRVEVKYILYLDCHDVQLGSESLVTKVDSQPAGETEKGILMYFSQPGESLWDIAKRYRVSCDSLKRMNPELEEGAATQPQRVILWRK